MSRSSKKGPYTDKKLLVKIQKLAPGSRTSIKTWSRSSTITPEMVGLSFMVHNGKDFLLVRATEETVGHKLGEFALTRKFIRHGGKIQKAEEASAKPAASAPATKK
ncbi:MAG: 30S ribosomal protein S19 [Candidatus Uhrbacteria bacterium]